MFEIAAIDHLVLRTDNPARMLAFYQEVLGCEVERTTGPDIGLTQLRAGSALIDIVAVDSRLGRIGGAAPTQTGNNLDHVCLQLKPISTDEIRAHLESKGVEVGEFVDRYGAQGVGPSLYIKDPDGNVVEVRSQQAFRASPV